MILPKLVAHRGYTAHYPENTLIGVEAAIDAGALFFEVDIQLSADQTPVLFHDRNLERLCGSSGAIHDYPLAKLRHLRASDFGRFGYKYANNPITTLKELVRLIKHHPQVTAFIELKRNSIEHFGVSTMVTRVLDVLQPVAQQCVIISYSLEALLAVRRQGNHQVGAVIDDWHQRHNSLMRRLEPDFFFCDIESLPRWRRLHMNDTRLAVYETVDPKQALAVAKRGIEFVETFAIGEMLAQIDILAHQS